MDSSTKNIKEQVTTPFSGLMSVPGMGSARPASMAATSGAQQCDVNALGSGDNWGNTLGPYQQGGNKKRKKKVYRKRKKVVKESLVENNINPYDKIGTGIARKMKIKLPFKKKKEKGNQNAIVQRNFEHQIITLKDYANLIKEGADTDSAFLSMVGGAQYDVYSFDDKFIYASPEGLLAYKNVIIPWNFIENLTNFYK